MTEQLRKIHDYLIEVGQTEENLYQMDTSSVYLAMEIMEYAHRNQRRENGEEYANHPSRVLQKYRDFVGIIPDDYFCIDENLLAENSIPFTGIQEVCLLHDVIEDTEFTMEDLKVIFNDVGLGKYFETFIEEPLALITHDKSEGYEPYIEKCLKHPTSALVKMLDMQDNLNMFELITLNKETYLRSKKYLRYIHIINDKYHYIENIQVYRQKFEEKRY